MAKPNPTLPPFTEQQVARLWSRIDKRGDDECWPWTSTVTRDGYGRFRLCAQGRRCSVRASRAVLTLTSGQECGELLACHTCDNRACCNPKHLYLGTHADNMRDKMVRGRNPTGERHHLTHHPEVLPRGLNHWSHTKPHLRPRGEKNGNAKVTESLVRAIREEHEKGGTSYVKLAKKYHVDKSNIYCLVKRKTWTHI